MIHIIGGAGFVGTRLAQVLGDQERAYRLYDKVLKGEQYLDVTLSSTFNVLPPADVVINLAAEHRDDVSPLSLYELVNVEGAKNVCNYCRENSVKQIIFTSSVAIYGFAPEDTDERGTPNPFNEYGRTKLEAEAVYRNWQQEDPEARSLVIIRPTVIFGEQNRGNVYNLLKQIANKRFLMFGPGTNRKSMAYIQNVVEFLVFCTRLGAGEHLYNYIDKPDLDMNALVRVSRSILFNKPNVGLRLPGWLGVLIGYGFDLLSSVLRKKLPISSIRVRKFLGTTAFNSSVKNTGFQPPVALEEGIARTLRYEFLEDHRGERVFFSE